MGAFFCLEGDSACLSVWKHLLQALGAQVQEISPESKARYHAACVIASNLACGLVQESLELLEDCGFSSDGALRALTPLLQSNLDHILRKGPVQALTGPVERGDGGTVEKHLRCLPEAALPLYRTGSRKLVEIARKKHPETDYTALEAILKEG